jgi:hypothetical protein
MGPVEMMANMPAGPDMGITDLLATLGGYQIENPDKRKKTENKPAEVRKNSRGKRNGHATGVNME